MAKRNRELPGLEKPSIKAVEDAAEEYVEVRDKRMALAKDEKARSLALVTVMKANRLKSYSFDGQIVKLDEIDKVSVKSSKDEEED